MTAFFKFLSNPIIVIIVATGVLRAGPFIRKMWIKKRDAKRIYEFLFNTIPRDYHFRSTEAIASNTKLSEARVEEICATHPKIRRNEKEKQSWTLVE